MHGAPYSFLRLREASNETLIQFNLYTSAPSPYGGGGGRGADVYRLDSM